MKILSKFFAIAIIGSAFACSNAPEDAVETSDAKEVETPEATTATYAVMTDGDEVMWEGFKTYSDDKHTGTIQVKTGEIMVDGDELVGGQFVIDMNSIKNEDLPEEGDYNKAKLVGHLMSEDFFYTSEYPTAKFTITGVEKHEGEKMDHKHGEAEADHDHDMESDADHNHDMDNATHMISGNLMMRGKEKNITIPAMVSMDGNMIMIKTPEFVIDRTEWDVMYLSKNLESVVKENAVDNNIKLKVDLKAKKS